MGAICNKKWSLPNKNLEENGIKKLSTILNTSIFGKF